MTFGGRLTGGVNAVALPVACLLLWQGLRDTFAGAINDLKVTEVNIW